MKLFVIFLNGMCPLLPDLVVCHSDLPTFSSSFCCCNVNWQTAFLLCLIVSAYYWFQLILYFYLFLALLYLGFSLSFMLPTIVSYLDTPLAAKLKKKKKTTFPKTGTKVVSKLSNLCHIKTVKMISCSYINK